MTSYTRQLAQYSITDGDGGMTIEYKYNDQGIRTAKKNSVWTHYTLDGDKVLVEQRGTGTPIYYTYDVDDSLISMNYNGIEYFYVTNLQGDIIELVDINGTTVAEYRYDAWGNIVYQSSTTIANVNPYRYRGYRFDRDTGYYYLQSRYYNPETGRFISSDGLFGKQGNLNGHNTYSYAENNPVMYVDPEGESIVLSILLVSAFTLSLIAMADNSANPEDNISINVGASPVPGAAFELLGIGFGSGLVEGSSCNLFLKCSNTNSTFGVLGPLQVTETLHENGRSELVGSLSILYLSFDPNNLGDIDSWGVGISLGYTISTQYGSSEVSLDIDYFQMIRDALRGQGGKNGE